MHLTATGGKRVSIWIWLLLGVALVLVAGFIYEQIGAARAAIRYPAPGRLIDIGGRRLHLLCKGEDHGKAGPTVVLETGAITPGLMWARVQDAVAGFSRVCLYDRAGYGWSDPASGERSVEQRVQELHTLLHKADVPQPYVLVGHSYGGIMARIYARNYRDEVAGMVLVDSAEEGVHLRPDVLSLYSKMLRVMAVMGAISRFGLWRFWQPLALDADSGFSLQVRSALNALMLRHDSSKAGRDEIESLERDAPALTALGAAGSLGSLPLVVINHGKPFPGPFAVLENYWGDGQKRLAALSSRGELIVAEAASHNILVESPDVIVAAIRRVVDAARMVDSPPT